MPVSRLTLVGACAVCALLVVVAPTTAASTGLKVLVTGNCGGDPAKMATAIQGQSGIASATPFDTSATTPSLAQMEHFGLVVSLGDCTYADAETFGDNLADYVDDGGVVLQVAYDNWNGNVSDPNPSPMGRFAGDGYAPLDLGPNANSSTTLGQLLKPNSPLLKGLGTFPTSHNTTTPLAAGATLLAKWADGRNAIAVKGRVVATSAATEDQALPDLARLARNTGIYFNYVPSTRITRAVIGQAAHTATFRYKGTGFTNGFVCGLARPGSKGSFKGCPAHKTYKNLKPGTYLFEVAAVGPGGADRTPAKKTFTIG
jgi:hypothetical protein